MVYHSEEQTKGQTYGGIQSITESIYMILLSSHLQKEVGAMWPLFSTLTSIPPPAKGACDLVNGSLPTHALKIKISKENYFCFYAGGICAKSIFELSDDHLPLETQPLIFHYRLCQLSHIRKRGLVSQNFLRGNLLMIS